VLTRLGMGLNVDFLFCKLAIAPPGPQVITDVHGPVSHGGASPLRLSVSSQVNPHCSRDDQSILSHNQLYFEFSDPLMCFLCFMQRFYFSAYSFVDISFLRNDFPSRFLVASCISHLLSGSRAAVQDQVQRQKHGPETGGRRARFDDL
jgi:hypothetical protein